MRELKVNKRKIFNDPVYGFVTVPTELIFDLIEHQCFQRLRRIKQLGLTHLVYPGALHTRFQHSLGAMHLMVRAINELRFKGQDITEDEALGVCISILLHDIGHGPYSHALEHSIVDGISHEQISGIFVNKLNKSFDGKLDLALEILNGNYKKKFLHNLVSGQFDMDRLDYLKRDSFFTGVSEGIVNYERLLSMINVVDDELVIEAKGIYSAEKFITARRLMYWQVYLHKTVVVAEYTIMKVLKRAKQLRLQGVDLFATPGFDFFLRNKITINEFKNSNQVIENFSTLDDFDIFTSMKVWTTHPDPVLSYLSKSIVNRRLMRIEMQNEPFDYDYVENIRNRTKLMLKLNEDEIDYFVFNDLTYKPGTDKIGILYKNGQVVDIAEASDQLNISLLLKPTTKYFLCYPKEIN
ncbi:MAG: HD domain-containing protein [Bacteroidetes bacterium]|nr:HD domain-containing protein [Bacteroidota bacterium]MBL6944720.1 HD domain-containing protein [Bacteroidales bacterium]